MFAFIICISNDSLCIRLARRYEILLLGYSHRALQFEITATNFGLVERAFLIWYSQPSTAIFKTRRGFYHIIYVYNQQTTSWHSFLFLFAFKRDELEKIHALQLDRSFLQRNRWCTSRDRIVRSVLLSTLFITSTLLFIHSMSSLFKRNNRDYYLRIVAFSIKCWSMCFLHAPTSYSRKTN